MVESVDIPTVMSGPVLEIVDLEYVIKDRRLFDGLNMTIGAGESVAVIGPSGSGKSTLLSCVLGLAKPDTGTVLVDGADVMSLRRQALARHRSRSIGMIFQFGELLPELSPIDNVALAALLSRADRATAYSRAATLLDDLGVPRVEMTDRLSGGERQRTAVARALINSPSLLLADEPTGALDSKTRDQVAEQLFALPGTRRCGLLVVTHDLTVAARADRVLELRDGVLKQADIAGVGGR